MAYAIHIDTTEAMSLTKIYDDDKLVIVYQSTIRRYLKANYGTLTPKKTCAKTANSLPNKNKKTSTTDNEITNTDRRINPFSAFNMDPALSN